MPATPPPAPSPCPPRARRRPTCRAAWIVPLLALAACGSPPGQGRATGAAPDTLAIGVALDPRRPALADVGAGAAMAVAELAASPAARARGVTFALRAPAPATPGAVETAERLRDDPGVIGIVGDAESGRTLDALPVLEDVAGGGRRAVAAVSPTATSPVLVGRSRWLFRLAPDDARAGRLVAAHLVDALGARRAAVAYRNDAYGREWAAAFARAFAARGGTVVARDPYLAGVSDWGVWARHVAALAPDAIVFPGSAEDAPALIAALRGAGVRAPLVGGDALAPLADAPDHPGVAFAAAFTVERATRPAAPPAGRAFVAAWRARHGRDPGARAALGYEAALLLGQAALAVDTRAEDRRARIRAWLEGLGRATPPMPGVIGPIAFDAGHGVVGRAPVLATAGPTAGAPVTVARAGSRSGR